METRHVEIERFAKKADGYRAALQAAPEARALELSVVGAILCGYCKKKGLPRKEARVVDLMAGSGYLSNHLKTLGFGNVSAVEACAEMLPDKICDGPAGVAAYRVKSIDDIDDVLDELIPHIVVSLAGFHHLIHYDGNKPDRFRSVLWQRRIFEKGIRGLQEGGLLLVADITEANAAVGLDVDNIGFWDASAFKELSVAPPDLREALLRTKNLAAYNDVISQRIGPNKVSPALRWFREIVDEKTSVGHEDMALSKELLELVSLNHRIAWSSFACPWLFKSREEAGFFLTRKFGFLVDRKVHEVKVEDVLADAARIAGLYEVGEGRVAFGWNLSVLAIGVPKSEGGPEQTIRRVHLWLGMLCLLLASRAILGWWVLDVFSMVKEFIDQVAYILAGGVLAEMAELAQWWIAKRRTKGE